MNKYMCIISSSGVYRQCVISVYSPGTADCGEGEFGFANMYPRTTQYLFGWFSAWNNRPVLGKNYNTGQWLKKNKNKNTGQISAQWCHIPRTIYLFILNKSRTSQPRCLMGLLFPEQSRSHTLVRCPSSIFWWRWGTSFQMNKEI